MASKKSYAKESNRRTKGKMAYRTCQKLPMPKTVQKRIGSDKKVSRQEIALEEKAYFAGEKTKPDMIRISKLTKLLN